LNLDDVARVESDLKRLRDPLRLRPSASAGAPPAGDGSGAATPANASGLLQRLHQLVNK